jgi:hypothetical protein
MPRDALTTPRAQGSEPGGTSDGPPHAGEGDLDELLAARLSQTAAARAATAALSPLPLPPQGRHPSEPGGLDNWPPGTLEAFLRELARFGNATEACRRTGLQHGSMYQLRERSPQFAAMWLEAIKQGTENLVNEARRRAAEGVVKPVFYKGRRALDIALDEDGSPMRDEDGELMYEPAGMREYSDVLLITLLKAYEPRFREAVTLKDERGSRDPAVDLTLLSDDELRDFRRILAKARPQKVIDVTPVPEEDAS